MSAGVQGSITPILLTGGSGNFTAIAGNTLVFSGPTSFGRVSFGGSNTFSLAANSTEFAGLYWDAQNGEFRMPVGYNYNNGSAFIRYSGANSPLVGTPISGGASGTFTRTYDFSITVDSVTQSVPEPLTILGAGAAISFGTAFKRKLAQKKDKAA